MIGFVYLNILGLLQIYLPSISLFIYFFFNSIKPCMSHGILFAKKITAVKLITKAFLLLFKNNVT